MADYKVVNATQLDNDLKGICDTIRRYPNSGYTDTDLFLFPDGIKQAISTMGMNVGDSGYGNGYNEGYISGLNDGKQSGYQDGYSAGKQAEYDRFWDAYQNNGTRQGYGYAFYLWDEVAYKPKYPIIMNYNSVQPFRGSTITDTLVDITVNTTTQQMFYQCKQLKTIRKIISTEKATFPNAFVDCSSLENLVMEGVVACSINISGAPKLSRASIESVFSCLSDTTTELTIVISETAKNNAFTTQEWDTLVGTKPNWIISLV